MKKKKLKKEIIHRTFVNYDLIGVISKGFPDDEYQLEESYIYTYIINNPNATELEIYNELVRIIEDWFGESPLHQETLNTLQKMAHDIYGNLISTIG